MALQTYMTLTVCPCLVQNYSAVLCTMPAIVSMEVLAMFFFQFGFGACLYVVHMGHAMGSELERRKIMIKVSEACNVFASLKEVLRIMYWKRESKLGQLMHTLRCFLMEIYQG